MNSGYTDEQLKESQVIDDSIIGVFNDLDAAKKVFELYPNFVYFNNKLYMFDADTGFWNTNKTQIFKLFENYDEMLYLLTTNSNCDVIKTNESYVNTSSLFNQCLPALKLYVLMI